MRAHYHGRNRSISHHPGFTAALAKAVAPLHVEFSAPGGKP